MKRACGPAAGAQRVAAFLLSLEKEDAARVMRHIDAKVVSAIAEAMTELDPELCTPEAVDGLVGDLARTVYKRKGVRPQDDFELHEMLASSFGAEEAERVLRAIHDRRRKEQPFAFVEAYTADVLARVLRQESSAVVALILAHISPGISAEVLGAFGEDRALDVVKRMTSVRPPGVETLLAIADDLRERLVHVASMPAPPDRAATLRSVADLLNFSDSDTERAVLEGLEQEDQAVAGEIRELMFTWEDLGAIEKRAMQKILAAIDTRTLAMALKACSPEVEANVLGNLSTRVRDMVADERELAGAVPLSDVLQARHEIMLAVRGLMDAGELSPARASEELVT